MVVPQWAWTEPDASHGVEYIILEGGGPDQGPGPDMDLNIAELREKLGPVDPESSRQDRLWGAADSHPVAFGGYGGPGDRARA